MTDNNSDLMKDYNDSNKLILADKTDKSSYEYQRNIEKVDKIIVGVNKFQIIENNQIPSFKIDDSIQKVQSDKLAVLKNKRDTEKVHALLNKIEIVARSNQNLMPIVIESVEHYCTLGEIADVLRKVFGEHK